MENQTVQALLSPAYILVQNTDIKQDSKWSNWSFQAGKHAMKKSKQGKIRVASTRDPILKRDPLSLHDSAEQLCWPFTGLMPTNGLKCLIGHPESHALAVAGQAWPVAPLESSEEGRVLICEGRVQSTRKSNSGPLQKMPAGILEASLPSWSFQAVNHRVPTPRGITDIPPNWLLNQPW